MSLRFKREKQQWASTQDSRCQSITRPRDLGEDAGDYTFLCPLFKASDMVYCARLAGVQAGGGARGQSALSNQTGQDGIRCLVRAVNLLFNALNTQPQPQAEGAHERTKEWRTVWRGRRFKVEWRERKMRRDKREEIPEETLDRRLLLDSEQTSALSAL